MRSGPPQQASSMPVARSSPSTFGAHPLSLSSLPSPQFSPSSPRPTPVLASLPIPSPPLSSLPTLMLFSLQHCLQVSLFSGILGFTSLYVFPAVFSGVFVCRSLWFQWFQKSLFVSLLPEKIAEMFIGEMPQIVYGTSTSRKVCYNIDSVHISSMP